MQVSRVAESSIERCKSNKLCVRTCFSTYTENCCVQVNKKQTWILREPLVALRSYAKQGHAKSQKDGGQRASADDNDCAD